MDFDTYNELNSGDKRAILESIFADNTDLLFNEDRGEDYDYAQDIIDASYLHFGHLRPDIQNEILSGGYDSVITESKASEVVEVKGLCPNCGKEDIALTDRTISGINSHNMAECSNCGYQWTFKELSSFNEDPQTDLRNPSEHFYESKASEYSVIGDTSEQYWDIGGFHSIEEDRDTYMMNSPSASSYPIYNLPSRESSWNDLSDQEKADIQTLFQFMSGTPEDDFYDQENYTKANEEVESKEELEQRISELQNYLEHAVTQEIPVMPKMRKMLSLIEKMRKINPDYNNQWWNYYGIESKASEVNIDSELEKYFENWDSDLGGFGGSVICTLDGVEIDVEGMGNSAGAKNRLLQHLRQNHPNIGNRVEKKLFTDESKAKEDFIDDDDEYDEETGLYKIDDNEEKDEFGNDFVQGFDVESRTKDSVEKLPEDKRKHDSLNFDPSYEAETSDAEYEDWIQDKTDEDTTRDNLEKLQEETVEESFGDCGCKMTNKAKETWERLTDSDKQLELRNMEVDEGYAYYPFEHLPKKIGEAFVDKFNMKLNGDSLGWNKIPALERAQTLRKIGFTPRDSELVANLEYQQLSESLKKDVNEALNYKVKTQESQVPKENALEKFEDGLYSNMYDGYLERRGARVDSKKKEQILENNDYGLDISKVKGVESKENENTDFNNQQVIDFTTINEDEIATCDLCGKTWDMNDGSDIYDIFLHLSIVHDKAFESKATEKKVWKYCNRCGYETEREEGESCPYHQSVLEDGTFLWDEFNQDGESKANEVSIDDFKRIVDRHQYEKLQFDDGEVIVDAFTANAVVQVYNALSEERKQKFNDVVKTSGGVSKLVDLAFKYGESKANEKIPLSTKGLKLPRQMDFKTGGYAGMNDWGGEATLCEICGANFNTYPEFLDHYQEHDEAQGVDFYTESKANERDFYRSNKEISDQGDDIQAEAEFGKKYSELSDSEKGYIEYIKNEFGDVKSYDEWVTSGTESKATEVRHLSSKQKSLIKNWVNDNRDSLSVFVTQEDLPYELLQEIESNRDYETLYSDITRYASDVVNGSESKASEKMWECFNCDGTGKDWMGYSCYHCKGTGQLSEEDMERQYQSDQKWKKMASPDDDYIDGSDVPTSGFYESLSKANEGLRDLCENCKEANAKGIPHESPYNCLFDPEGSGNMCGCSVCGNDSYEPNEYQIMQRQFGSDGGSEISDLQYESKATEFEDDYEIHWSIEEFFKRLPSGKAKCVLCGKTIKRSEEPDPAIGRYSSRPEIIVPSYGSDLSHHMQSNHSWYGASDNEKIKNQYPEIFGESKATEDMKWWECEDCKFFGKTEDETNKHELETGHTTYGAGMTSAFPVNDGLGLLKSKKTEEASLSDPDDKEYNVDTDFGFSYSDKEIESLNANEEFLEDDLGDEFDNEPDFEKMYEDDKAENPEWHKQGEPFEGEGFEEDDHKRTSSGQFTSDLPEEKNEPYGIDPYSGKVNTPFLESKSKAEEAYNKGASAEEIYSLVDDKGTGDDRSESEEEYLNNLYNKTNANKGAGFSDLQ